MLTILINASIIWLCSLLVYELLLQKETFHQLNRFYMLLTFIAGVVLPLLPWEQSVIITTIKSDVNVLPHIVSNPTPAVAAITSLNVETQNNTVNWWLLLYIVGVVAGILYVLHDMWRLWFVYRRSTIRREGRWIIAETGKPHGPFSILHIIFISSREQYTDKQWQMVLQHEQQHQRSGHILDLVLLQVAVILLWFHPLVYIYRYKLRMLHEYEVDSRQKEDPHIYGRFLLEQAVLGSAPVISHSFSISPLKNRLYMMTKNPSKSNAKYRLLLLLPMLSVFILCCTQIRKKVEIDIKNRYAMRHDIKLEYSTSTPADTFRVSGSSGQKEMVVAAIDPFPVKLNNKDLLQPGNLSVEPICVHPGSKFGIKYLIQQTGLESTLKKMADGKYFMSVSNIIIDPSGHIVYYMLTFPENWEDMTTGPGGFNYAKPSGLTDADKNHIQKKISEVLIGGNIAFKPIKNEQGDTAPYILESHNGESSFELGTMITVRNHTLSYKG